MSYRTALILAASIGAAASVYTPKAEAAGVWIAPPVAVYAPPVIAAGYFGPRRYWGAGYYFGGYPRYGRGFYGYGHAGFGYRHWGYHRR
jgi:hypothetical protein